MKTGIKYIKVKRYILQTILILKSLKLFTVQQILFLIQGTTELSNSPISNSPKNHMSTPTKPTIQSLTSNIIKTTLSYSSLPIISLHTSLFPDPTTTDYNALSLNIIQQLDLLVESDYILVLFVTCNCVPVASFAPGYYWMLSRYRYNCELIRDNYHGNLKRTCENYILFILLRGMYGY